MLFFISYCLCKAQTIEKKYTNFELVTNAKNVKEYNLSGITNDQQINFEQVDKLFLANKLKSRKSNEYSFNAAGYLVELKTYYTNPKVLNQGVYSYDDKNLLLEIIEKESPIDTINYSDYLKVKITRNNDEVTKTWTYAKEDTVYIEKFRLKNNYIVKENAPNSNNIRRKIEFDKNYNRLSGKIILASGEKLTWKNIYTFYPNGVVKSKQCLWTDLLTKTTETFFPNGLIKTETSKNKVLKYIYKYDQQGNWIYKMIYKNKKPNKLLKREISYF